MVASISQLLPQLLVAATTYLLHSSLLLAAAWLLTRWMTSPHLTERVWKTAALMGLATTALQLGGSFANPLFDLALHPRHGGWLGSTAGSPQSNTLGAALRSDPSHPTADEQGINQRELNFATSLGERGTSVPRLDRRSTDAPETGRLTPAARREELATTNKEQASGGWLGSTAGSPQSIKLGDALRSDASHPTHELNADNPPGLAVVFFQAGHWPWKTLAGLIVVTLVLAGGLRFGWQSLGFRRHVALCRPIERGRACQLLDAILRRARVHRRVRLLASSNDPAPAAFGVLRWHIVLPEGIERRLSRDELEAVLAHEVAHLVRGDTAFLLVGRLLCTCFAFQPLNFLARQEWEQAAELLSDDWAVLHAADRLALARCLTRAAEWQLDGVPVAGTLAAADTRSNLSRRVERLVAGTAKTDPRMDRGRMRTFVMSAAVAFCLMSIWGPRVSLSGDRSQGSGIRSQESEVGDQRSEVGGQRSEVGVGIADAPGGQETGGAVVALRESAGSLQAELDRLQHEMHKLDRVLSDSPQQEQWSQRVEPIRQRVDNVIRRGRAAGALINKAGVGMAVAGEGVGPAVPDDGQPQIHGDSNTTTNGR